MKTPCLRIFQMEEVYLSSRAESTNWWKSFLRVTEILISYIQLMQPDRRSWLRDWMSPRKHPVCHIMGGCPSRNPSAATAGNWIPGSIRIWSDPAQPLQPSHGSQTQLLCTPQLPPPELQPHWFKQSFTWRTQMQNSLTFMEQHIFSSTLLNSEHYVITWPDKVLQLSPRGQRLLVVPLEFVFLRWITALSLFCHK